jgi:hypothetical protein
MRLQNIRKPPIRTFYHVHYRGLSSKCEGSGFFYCKYINNKEKLRIEANLKETPYDLIAQRNLAERARLLT